LAATLSKPGGMDCFGLSPSQGRKNENFYTARLYEHYSRAVWFKQSGCIL